MKCASKKYEESASADEADKRRTMLTWSTSKHVIAHTLTSSHIKARPQPLQVFALEHIRQIKHHSDNRAQQTRRIASKGESSILNRHELK
jgi:hypothetical protein